jgi:hypothetical protein
VVAQRVVDAIFPKEASGGVIGHQLRNRLFAEPLGEIDDVPSSSEKNLSLR